MKLRKKEEDKKVKFTICVDPVIYKKMEDEMIKKSRLIETLLKEHYGKKDL
jgi:hydroxymethylpyrimidine/phosphomethylpyrimidine kinase